MNPTQIMQMVAQLKQQYGANADPEEIIRQMMQSGQISQSAYDAGVRELQRLQQMFSPSVHR